MTHGSSRSTQATREHAPTGTVDHPRALIIAASFCCLVVALQQTLVIPAVPHLPKLLDSTPDMVSWLVTATLLTGAVATPIFGRLSDLVGKRRMLVVSMLFVLVGSVIAPLGGIGLVIAGRALQGVGTALVPVAMAQMRDSLPGHQVGVSLAVLSATLGVGGSVGIPLGGVILAATGWQSLFWLSAVLTVIALIAIFAVVPPNRSSDAGSFDYAGAVLLSLCLLALLMVVSNGGAWGWLAPQTIILGVVGVGLAAWWTVFELRQDSPMVDLRTSTHRPLLFTNLASLLLGVMMFTNLLLTTRRLQNPVAEAGFGWDAAAAGLAMLPTAVIMFAVAPFSARVAAVRGSRFILTLGSAIGALGYIGAAFGATSAALTITWTTIISAGVGIGYAALPMLIAEYAPGHEIGSANGVNALLRAIGTAIGSSAVGAFTAAFVVTRDGASTPSHVALLAIALFGLLVGVITTFVSSQARASKRATSSARSRSVVQAAS